MNKKIPLILFLVLLFISCDKEVTVFPEPEVNDVGKIIVDSKPSGAMIYLNDRITGYKTPDTLKYVNEGEYKVSLELQYFYDTAWTTGLSVDEIKNYDVNYFQNERVYGSIMCETNPPGANIYLDDSLLAQKTPFLIEKILPGVHTVRYSYEEHRDVVLRVPLWSEQKYENKVVLQDTSVWVDYQTANSGIQSDRLTYVEVDQNGTKWIGTADNGLIKYNGGDSFVNYNTSNSEFPSNLVSCIRVDSKNNVWVGTDYGMAVFSNGVMTVYDTSNSPLPGRYVDEFGEKNGKIYIGTSKGLVVLDNGTWNIFNIHDNKVSNLLIQGMALDMYEGLWCGTNQYGIIKLDRMIYDPPTIIKYSIIPVFTASQYPISPNIRYAAVDHENKPWFSHVPFSGKGIDYLGAVSCVYRDGRSFGYFIKFFGDPWTDVVESFNFDEKDNMWVCGTFGLYRAENAFNQNKVLFTKDEIPLPVNHTTAITVDNNDNVFITTMGGGLLKKKGGFPTKN